MVFAQQQTLVPEFDRLFKTLTTLQTEFWNAMGKPKASRGSTLAKEYTETTNALLETLDKLSGTLAADVNHKDAMIDQLLTIKQIAWLLRNTGGEASLIISNGLAAGRISPEIHVNYTKLLGGTEIAWKALELTIAGMPLPATLASAMTATKTAYFEQSYLDLRERLLKALLAGEKAELTANQWSPITVGRLAAAVGVAEGALDAARAHSATQYSSAQRSLVIQLALLVAAFALTFGAMTLVSRRVIKPLRNMRDAMLKVASGDLNIDTGYSQRKDEIGALDGALDTFKQQAADKARIETQERERNAGATARQISKAMSASSRTWWVRHSTNSATPQAKCAPLRPACRRFPVSHRRSATGCCDAGNHAQHAICGTGHQERLRQHDGREGRRLCGGDRRRRRQARLRDVGDEEPATRQSGDAVPRQDPRGVIAARHHSAATTGTR
jgi:HAMP domain-containing protein